MELGDTLHMPLPRAGHRVARTAGGPGHHTVPHSSLFCPAPWVAELPKAPKGSAWESGQWVARLRQRFSGPSFEEFLRAVRGWQMNSARLKHCCAELLADEGVHRFSSEPHQHAALLLDSLAAAPAQAPVLYRGLGFFMPQDEVDRRFQERAILRLLPQSFTASHDIAAGFAGVPWQAHEATPDDSTGAAIFRLAPGSRSLLLEPFSAEERFWMENEWLAAGTFEITSCSSDGEGRLLVDLVQRGGVKSLHAGRRRGGPPAALHP